MSAWFYLNDQRKAVGPISQDELVVVLAKVSHADDALVWTSGLDGWKSVAEFPQLLRLIENQAPRPPPVPAIQRVQTIEKAPSQPLGDATPRPASSWGREGLKTAGAFLFVAGIAAGLGTLLLALFFGAAWASEHLLRYVFLAAQWAIILCIFVLAPLSLIRRTRAFSAFGFFSCSYVFGTCLWMMGLLTAYFYWGLKSVIIGMFLFGVGVVPVGLLASIINADWAAVWMMLIGVALTYGSRMLSFWMFDRV